MLSNKRMQPTAHGIALQTPPGSIWQTPETTLRLIEGLVRVTSRGLIPVKGLLGPMEVTELTGTSAIR